MTADPSERYHLEFATAFIRGRLADAPALPPVDLFRHGQAAGLRLHRFKRSAVLPRVRRVFGYLRQLAPGSLLDVGTGRGAFLWPLLRAFPDLRVHCTDVRADRVADLQAVAAGGVARLSASVMDVTRPGLGEGSFDGVTMLEVLEHVARPAEAVAAAVRLARRFVLVSVPSKPDDNPEHVHLFDGDALAGLFREAGVTRFRVDYVPNHVVALAMRGGHDGPA